jgi:hypothetical protein
MTQWAWKASPNPHERRNGMQDAEQELLQIVAELQSQERPSIPPIVSPHPFLKFQPPLIPGFRVSEQPYKSHSVPLTVMEWPQQDPTDDPHRAHATRAE